MFRRQKIGGNQLWYEIIIAPDIALGNMFDTDIVRLVNIVDMFSLLLTFLSYLKYLKFKSNVDGSYRRVKKIILYLVL